MTVIHIHPDSPRVVLLGKQGETGVRTIAFDVREWLEEFPSGVVTIIYTPPTGDAYPAVLAARSSPVKWIVTDTDTAEAGDGTVELILTDNGIVDKSATLPTFVLDSSASSGRIPEPRPDWTIELAKIALQIGDLDDLDTEAKSNLVAAINEAMQRGGPGGDFDIHGLVQENDLADADETPFYDASVQRQRKTTWANVKAKLKAYFDNIYLSEHQSLADYASKAWVEAKGYITSLAGYATEAWVTAKDYATKAFVNSSIGTNTAYYISNNGQPFQSLAQLQAYSGTVTNNDYAFIVGSDSAGNTTYTRYKYNADTHMWGVEYVLNNSSFTAAQWAAIQSGITAEDVALIGTALQPEALNDYETAEETEEKYQSRISVAQFTLPANGWDDNEQTVSVSGVKADETAQFIDIFPASADYNKFLKSGIICIGQGANTLTFSCFVRPTADISMIAKIEEV